MKRTPSHRVTKHAAVFLIALAYLFFPRETRSSASPADQARPPFQWLRYDEDYSFLADPARRTEFWDAVKYIPIAGARAGFLSFGVDARERFETYENELFRTNPNADNAYFLQRYMLHADYHFGACFRVFGQLQSSLEDGRPGGPRATDRDTIDVHQFFADLAMKTGEDGRLTLRVGRQEMSYGSERLIGVREGPNNRRAFDAVRVLYHQGSLTVDAFISTPVEVDPGPFDDQNIRDVWFWGLYATIPIKPLPLVKADFYYLGLQNPHAVFNQGAATEERHTLGSRLSGTIGHLDLNNEAVFQFGHFGSGDITAWSVATDQGFTLTNLWARPRLGLKAAIASGDQDASNPDLQTLNPLFPAETISPRLHCSAPRTSQTSTPASSFDQLTHCSS